MPKTFPYFPFYPDDFAADAVVEMLSTTGIGCYALLLCKAWRESPPGTLPDDDRLLSRWSRLANDPNGPCMGIIQSSVLTIRMSFPLI